jgi:hypothetical protein
MMTMVVRRALETLRMRNRNSRNAEFYSVDYGQGGKQSRRCRNYPRLQAGGMAMRWCVVEVQRREERKKSS